MCAVRISPHKMGGMRLCEWVEGERVTQFCCSHRVEKSNVSTTESASICVGSAAAEMPEKYFAKSLEDFPRSEIRLATNDVYVYIWPWTISEELRRSLDIMSLISNLGRRHVFRKCIVAATKPLCEQEVVGCCDTPNS